MNRFPSIAHRFPNITKTRLHAIAAGAAFVFLAGLSAPAAVFAGSDSTTTPDTNTAGAIASAVITDDASTKDAAAPATNAAAAAPAPAAPAPAPAPSGAQLHPAGVNAEQARFTPTVEQLSNARAIVEAGKAMGLPPRAWVIAVGTSLQESQLKNVGDLGDSNDHDSLGLFQQRPSSGWGTPSQLQDPKYAATAFYKGLVDVKGWESMPMTKAAQSVQVSAFPDHYAKHESEAGDMILALYGQGPFAEVGTALAAASK